MPTPLNNIFWNSLNGAHAHFSSGNEEAKRYSKGFSPIVGFPQIDSPNLTALKPFVDVDEQFYCGGWTGHVAEEWQLHADASMFRMVWTGAIANIDIESDSKLHQQRFPELYLRQLQSSDAQQAVDLAKLTNPGPFGMRTIELGEYLGYFDNDRLVAMSGERMQAAQFHEVSGVCTHPDYQGKGLARRLMNRIISHQLARGEIPFLHVMSHNHSAHDLYLRMGFTDDCETPVRVMSLKFR
ncbi:GNAT family N-acetyltransferase [Undibacterium sp. LX40W]|uniref:GNAT family N-acetyltransferase n=1 Tax=Undibacterium nitidum TaxID=2762298 RepID=A0A923HWF5_9BURK|nr:MULTISPECIES: GNAT family N-acetyltransferase [Undibacterium]MBC3882639.1 GNAT family N-acetyltransferase [Undibacterium nitidum]MBC3892920.1 GNAT family N-acetyltransferase [Undibacterium sp. LX40W]